MGQGDSHDPHLHLSPSFLPLVRLGTGVVPCSVLPCEKCPDPWVCPSGLPLIPLFIRAHTPHSRVGHPDLGLIFHQLLSHRVPAFPLGQVASKELGVPAS